MPFMLRLTIIAGFTEFLAHIWEFLLFFFPSLNREFASIVVIPFFFIGLFVGCKKNDQERSKEELYIIQFFKFSVIYTFSIFIIMFYLYYYSRNDQLRPFAEFLFIMHVRLYEIFGWFWVFLTIIGLTWAAKGLEISLYKSKWVNNFVSKVKYAKLSNILREKRVLFYVFLITFSSIHYYSFTKNAYAWNMYQDDLYTETVLWIGNFFNENPLEEKNTIFVYDLGRNLLYSLFNDINLEVVFYSEMMLANYTEFLSNFNSSAQYALIKISDIAHLNINFGVEFFILYQNSNYSFIEYRV